MSCQEKEGERGEGEGVEYRVLFAGPEGDDAPLAAFVVRGGRVLPPCAAGEGEVVYVVVDPGWEGAARLLRRLLEGDAGALLEALGSAVRVEEGLLALAPGPRRRDGDCDAGLVEGLDEEAEEGHPL
ncbi:MAG: hypothetical protein QW324_05855 [Thermofilaceae archaeon]